MPPVSLNEPVGAEDESELADFVPGEPSDDPAAVALASVRRSELGHALASLPARERRIPLRHYGPDGDPATLQTIGKELGVTRERVRATERNAPCASRNPSTRPPETRVCPSA